MIIDSLKKRRTYYNIGKSIPISDDQLIDLVNQVTKLTPDAFNMKSARVVIALGDHQDKLWDGIYDAFGGKVDREKIDSFKAGHGTILYFIDTAVVNGLKEKFPTYAQNFDPWSNHANGMLQYAIWNALRDNEIGASLQHYNPVIDDMVREMFDLPQSWKLIAQMPFGEIKEEPAAKPAENIADRVKVAR